MSRAVRRTLVGVVAWSAVLVTMAAGQPADVAPMATDTLYVCTAEDGSDPGQPFPCLWDGSTMGNGHGSIYVLTSAG